MHTTNSKKLTYLAACLMTLALGHSLNAASYTWDTSATGGIQGGSGVWQGDGGPANWTLDGVNRVIWTNTATNTSTFAGASGGTISLANDILTGGLTFATTGYTLTSQSATRRTTTVGGDITVDSGVTAVVGNLATVMRGQTLLLTGGGTLQVDTGGELNVTSSYLAIRGATGATTLNVNGGSVNVTSGSIRISTSSSQYGTLNLNSGTVSATGISLVSAGGGASGTMTLNGGKLITSEINQQGSSSRTGYFYFNGGTLATATANTAFLNGITGAYVQGGGAKIQTDHNISIGQALLHSGTAAIDGGLVKTGTSALTVTGASTYTGMTAINAGTLVVDNDNTTTSRLAGTTDVVISSDSTLSLTQGGLTASTDRINNSAAVTLAGGTFSLNGNSEGAAGVSGVGAFSLTANSIIDFGSISGGNLIQFAGLGTHSGGTTLSVLNWESGLDRFLFAGSDMTAFSSLYDQSSVSFNGVTGYQLASFGTYYEVSAVPEPGVIWMAAFGLGTLILLRKRSRSAQG